MSRKTDALKRMLVALNYGTAVSEYTGETTVEVLKELAVKLQCASSAEEIRATKITGVLDYITDNYGTEAKEPFDLSITGDEHVTLSVKVNGKNATAGADMLYNGDKVKVTATAAEGYTLSTLTINGEAIESGSTYVVNGSHVAIVAAATASE